MKALDIVIAILCIFGIIAALVLQNWVAAGAWFTGLCGYVRLIWFSTYP